MIAASSDLIWLRKPIGSHLPIAVRMLNELADLCQANRITLADIKDRQVFQKIPKATLEQQIVNGYYNILPDLVERVIAWRKAAPSDIRRVLIIDEINRGNVSKIFGELITLLEDTKREGMDEALSVTLPYSGEWFAVPKSLYVIGTMNTADKSLTTLDVALRRRFHFEELEPQPSLLEPASVDGVSVSELLSAMNARLEVLVDRDHRMGHATFMPLMKNESLDQLRSIFKRQVIPYLQELFFDDWSRVRLVLNDQLKKDERHKFIVEAGDAETTHLGVGSDTKRWILNPAAFDDLKSYSGIIEVDE